MIMRDREPFPASVGPVTWPDVIAKIAPVYEKGLSFFDDLPEDLASTKPPQYAGARLGGFDATVAALAALRGPASVAAPFAMIASQLPHVIEQLGGAIESKRVLPGLYTISTLNVARCCGIRVPPEADELEQRSVQQLADNASLLNERERHTAALAACAAARPSLVPALAELPALDETFAPGKIFGFNVSGFCGYLATAIDRGGTYENVELAWLDFVHRFPYKLDTTMLGWPALMWAARAVYRTIGDLPESEVTAELHKLVTGA